MLKIVQLQRIWFWLLSRDSNTSADFSLRIPLAEVTKTLELVQSSASVFTNYAILRHQPVLQSLTHDAVSARAHQCLERACLGAAWWWWCLINNCNQNTTSCWHVFHWNVSAAGQGEILCKIFATASGKSILQHICSIKDTAPRWTIPGPRSRYYEWRTLLYRWNTPSPWMF